MLKNKDHFRLKSGDELYKTRSAILFLIFNRPDNTARVFEQIRTAKPRRLYIAADGPRRGSEKDTERCAETRNITNKIDWDCNVSTLFRNENMGCKRGVSAAISWFFEHEEEGIILEDDCLPANSFFKFCDVLLEKYRHDERVMHITGCNLQAGRRWGNASYYFSNRVHVWGWAGWRRAWQGYDLSLEKYADVDVYRQFKNIYADDFVAGAWARIFDEMRTGKINSWAYALDFEVFFNNGLTIIPNINLISNIGFDTDATNTHTDDPLFAANLLAEMEEINHPAVFIPQKDADLQIIYHHFGIEDKKRRYNKINKRFIRWMKSMFNKKQPGLQHLK